MNAYDVRISDWSSDVCASDLVTEGIGGEHVSEPGKERWMRVNLMSLLAALAMISPAALAQSGSGADDQTAAPTQAETDVERSDSGPGGQGDTSEGTPDRKSTRLNSSH